MEFNFYNHLKALNMSILSDEKINKIIRYIQFLKDENVKKNLISRKATDEDIFKFIKSSLVFVKHIQTLNPKNILDIGSGSGFPAIVCAICFPEINFSVMDSTQKKIDFLYDVANIVELKNLECYWGRIEDFSAINSLKASFDIVTAMAVGTIELTTDYALPFLIEQGIFLTIKSYNQEQEFERAKKYLNAKFLSFDLCKEEIAESYIINIKKGSKIDKKNI